MNENIEPREKNTKTKKIHKTINIIFLRLCVCVYLCMCEAGVKNENNELPKYIFFSQIKSIDNHHCISVIQHTETMVFIVVEQI